MTKLRMALVSLIALALAACATQSYSPDQAPEYVVIREFAKFYRLGPMQARGPDSSLPVQTRVKLLRKEMGYYYVMLEDGRAGYVASEDLTLAPPRPPQPPASLTGDNPQKPGSRGRNVPNSPRYRGEQNNDIPLPDVIAPPDLNIAPEDVPSATPPPQPAEKPKFRF